LKRRSCRRFEWQGWQIRERARARIGNHQAADGNVFNSGGRQLELGQLSRKLANRGVGRYGSGGCGNTAAERAGDGKLIAGNREGSAYGRGRNHVSGRGEREVVNIANARPGGGDEVANQGEFSRARNRQAQVAESNLVGGRGDRAARGNTGVAVVDVNIGPVSGNTSAQAAEGETGNSAGASDIQLQKVDTLGIGGYRRSGRIVGSEGDVQRAAASETFVGVDRRRVGLFIGDDEVGSGRDLGAHRVVGEEGIRDIIILVFQFAP